LHKTLLQASRRISANSNTINQETGWFFYQIFLSIHSKDSRFPKTAFDMDILLPAKSIAIKKAGV